MTDIPSEPASELAVRSALGFDIGTENSRCIDRCKQDPFTRWSPKVSGDAASPRNTWHRLPLASVSTVDTHRMSFSGSSQDLSEDEKISPTCLTPVTREGRSRKSGFRVLRVAEICVKNLDCAVSEAIINQTLGGMSYVKAIQIDAINSTLYITYELSGTSALNICRALKALDFQPLKCSLRTLATPSKETIAQLTLAIPPGSRNKHGWAILQNHAMAIDGIKSCIISSDGAELNLCYDSTVIGARDIQCYMNGSGIDCSVSLDMKSEKQILPQFLRDPRFLIPTALILGVLQLWMSSSPPDIFERCVFGTVLSGTAITHLLLSSVSCIIFAAPIIQVGFIRLKNPSNICGNAVLTGAGLALMSLAPAVTFYYIFDNSTPSCKNIALNAPFNVLSWTFILWYLGLAISKPLKRQVARHLNRQQDYLSNVTRVRLFEASAAKPAFYLPKDQVQLDDELLIRSGERIPFDGEALSTSIIQAPPLVCSSCDLRPNQVERGVFVPAGSLVMSGDLRVKVTGVATSELQSALSAVRVSAASRLHNLLVLYAPLYTRLCCIAGAIVGIIVTVRAYKTEAFLIALTRGVCSGVGLSIMGITRVFQSASLAVATSAHGFLSSLGVEVRQAPALFKAASLEHVILCRSILASQDSLQVGGIMLAPVGYAAVKNALAQAEMLRPAAVAPAGLNYKVREIKVQGSSAGCAAELEEMTTMIWRLILQLEEAKVSRIGSYLYDQAFAHLTKPNKKFKDGSVRYYSGKGVEGVWKNGTIVAAAGSLDFIVACHQYSVKSSEEVEEWHSLRAWAERCMSEGHEIVVVACNGIPLAAILLREEFSPQNKETIKYIKEQLKLNVWICTGNSVLSARSLSDATGVPMSTIIADASKEDKLKCISRISQSAGGHVAFITSSSSTLASLAVEQGYSRPELSILSGRGCAAEGGVDVRLAAPGLLGLINLVLVARGTRALNRLVLGLVVVATSCCLAFFAYLVPKYSSLARYAPPIALLALFLMELVILLLSLCASNVTPAVAVRAPEGVPKSCDDVENGVLVSTSCASPLSVHLGPSQLKFPSSSMSVMLVASLLKVAGWIKQLGSCIRHFATNKSGDDLDDVDRLLSKLSETETQA